LPSQRHPFTLARAPPRDHHLHMSMTGISRRVIAEPVKVLAKREEPTRREPLNTPQPVART